MATQTITIPNFSYPFKKSNELEYFTNSSKEGNYLFNKDGFWHGGVHFIEEEISTLNDGDSKAIKCIADGEIVACRVNDKYLQNDGETDLERGLYSTGFFLVRHKIEYPKDNKLTFFSLYMHTAKKDEYLKLPKVVKHDLIGINTPVNSVNILQMPFKVQAGEIIAIAGLYNTDESKDLECLHLEVFADEKIEEFINKAQIYYQSDTSPNKPKAKNLEVPANIKKYKDQNYTLVKLIKNANIREGFSNTSATYQNSPTPRGTSVFIDKNTKTQVGEHLRYKVLKIGETDVSSQNLTIADITFEIKRDTNAYAENGIVEQKLNLVNVEKKVGANGITYVKIDNDFYVMEKDCIEIHPVTFSWARVFKNVTQDKVSIFKDLKKVLNGEESEFTDGFRDLCLNIDKDDHRGVLSAMEIEEATQNEEVKKLTSKYIVSHPNEWKYEESKWGQIKEILKDEEDKKHIENEQKRIEKFSLFEECKSIQDFPEDANKVYHINPIGLIGEFGVSKCGINIDKFIEEYKVQFGTIPTIYENNLKSMLRNIMEFYSKYTNYRCKKHNLSYILATTKHETNATYEGVNEAYWLSDTTRIKYYQDMYDPILGKNNLQKAKAIEIGNNEEGDGEKYYGRGYCQLTGKTNYKKCGEYLNINLLSNPNLANNIEYATKIILYGMETGLFTGKKLSDYITNTEIDYFNARSIINGDKNIIPRNETISNGNKIKSYALKIEKCFEKAM